MKYLKQIIIIVMVCFAGELLNYILPIPVPAGIYGMMILFLLLLTGVLKLEQIEDAANFLLDIMPLLFVPAAVGIMEESERLKQVWLQIIIITIVTTVIVMAVSGRVTQWLVRHTHFRNAGNVEQGKHSKKKWKDIFERKPDQTEGNSSETETGDLV